MVNVSGIISQIADALDPTRPWQRRWNGTCARILEQPPIITEEADRKAALKKLEESGNPKMEKWARSVRERLV